MGKRKIDRSFVVVIIMAAAAFFGFRPLFSLLNDSAAQQFTSAVFGTIFAAVITMVLLKRQTESEQTKERDQRVFEERVNLFNTVLDKFAEILEDGTINAAEVHKLQFMSLRIAMLGSDEIIEKFTGVYRKIVGEADDAGTEGGDIVVTPDILSELGELSLYFRRELGLSDANTRQMHEIFKKIEQTNQALQNKVEGRIKYVEGGESEWLRIQKEKGLGRQGELALQITRDLYAELSKKYSGLGPIKFTNTALSFVTRKESGKENNCYYINMAQSPALMIFLSAYDETVSGFPGKAVGYAGNKDAAKIYLTEIDFADSRSALLKYMERNIELVRTGKLLKPLRRKDRQADEAA